MGSSGEPCTSPSEFVTTTIDGAEASLDLVWFTGHSTQEVVGTCTGQAGGLLSCIDSAGASLDLVTVGAASSRWGVLANLAQAHQSSSRLPQTAPKRL